MRKITIKLVDILGLTGIDYITHDESGKYFDCKIGIIDLDEVELLEIKGEHYFKEEQANLIKEFITKYPDYCVNVPYEGYVTYFFSKIPSVIELEDVHSLHRGAIGKVKNAPKNALILMDLD